LSAPSSQQQQQQQQPAAGSLNMVLAQQLKGSFALPRWGMRKPRSSSSSSSSRRVPRAVQALHNVLLMLLPDADGGVSAAAAGSQQQPQQHWQAQQLHSQSKLAASHYVGVFVNKAGQIGAYVYGSCPGAIDCELLQVSSSSSSSMITLKPSGMLGMLRRASWCTGVDKFAIRRYIL
jgi:hypothetical protein